MRWRLFRVGLLVALGSCALDTGALAVPAFARQSGLDCNDCHFSWPELTSKGRRFKLGGYQLNATDASEKRPLISFDFDGPAPWIPLAVQVQLSDTFVPKLNHFEDAGSFSHIGEPYIQQASVFLNGQLAPGVGCFCQWSYDGITGRVTADNEDLRIAREWRGEHAEATYGLSLNNNPTVTDIFNTTPAWSWPYAASEVAVVPVASPIIEGQLPQSVAGLNAYALLQNTVYVEVGAYHNTDHGLQIMAAGVPLSMKTLIDGYAPYYRLALQQEWHHARHSVEIGAFGLSADVYPNQYSPSGPTNHYRDNGFDAQYQYVTDRHRFSVQAALVREEKTLYATYGEQGASNPADWVNQFNVKASYYFERQYGFSAGYQRVTGSTDPGLYTNNSPITNSLNGNPDTQDIVGELNYVFSITGRADHRTARLVLQYTGYLRFNGGVANYDGNGRRASDNNTLYLLLRVLY